MKFLKKCLKIFRNQFHLIKNNCLILALDSETQLSLVENVILASKGLDIIRLKGQREKILEIAKFVKKRFNCKVCWDSEAKIEENFKIYENFDFVTTKEHLYQVEHRKGYGYKILLKEIDSKKLNGI